MQGQYLAFKIFWLKQPQKWNLFEIRTPIVPSFRNFFIQKIFKIEKIYFSHRPQKKKNAKYPTPIFSVHPSFLLKQPQKWIKKIGPAYVPSCINFCIQNFSKLEKMCFYHRSNEKKKTINMQRHYLVFTIFFDKIASKISFF